MTGSTRIKVTHKNSPHWYTSLPPSRQPSAVGLDRKSESPLTTIKNWASAYNT